MNRFDEIKNKAPEKITPPFREMDMWLDCQTCNEEVETARFYPNENALIYECSKGHRSMIEGLML